MDFYAFNFAELLAPSTIVWVVFLIIMVSLYFYIKKSLNVNVKENFTLALQPFKTRILTEGLLFLGLLILRGLLSFNIIEIEDYVWINKVITVLIFIMLARLISLILDIIDVSYSHSRMSLRRPLKPFFQAIKILLVIIVIFGIIAIILDKDPFVVMGSVSTLLAFLSFIFKDILLGFFAGIQLTANDTIRIGDYISIPKLDINGTVNNIGLTSLTLVSTNQTHTTVGTYLLTQNPIVNFRHLSTVVGRQYVKRFNFSPNNQMNLTQLISDLKDHFYEHQFINQEKTISVQIEEGPMNNLVLVISLFSMHPDFNSFDEFSTQLSLSILDLMSRYNLFKTEVL